MNEEFDNLALSEIMSTFEFTKCVPFARRARAASEIRASFTYPEPGSPLAMDDQALRPLHDEKAIEGLSSTVKLTALMAETQLLEAWPAGPVSEDGVRVVAFPPYTGYTLLRGSMEASALALWLVEGQDSHTRLGRFRGLITKSQDEYFGAISEFHASRGTGDSDDAKSFNSRVQEIFDIARTVKINWPGSTRLLEKAGRIVPSSDLRWSPKVAWQVSSGVAHGLPWSIQEAIKIVQDKSTGAVRHKVDAESFRCVYQVATVMFEALVKRIAELQSTSGKSS